MDELKRASTIGQEGRVAEFESGVYGGCEVHNVNGMRW
jgi:hypothetical protein